MGNFIQKLGFFVVIMGMTSCSVYHQDNIDVQSAIDSRNRVKVQTVDNLIFELRELRREENGQLVGITGRKSETAKLMVDRPLVREGQYIKVPLEDEEIFLIHLKNKKMSNIVNFGVPVIGVAGFMGLTRPNFRPNMGY